mgnify:CR=1 FL=1
MAKVRVEFKRGVFREVRTSQKVLAELEKRADRIAAAAGSGYEAGDAYVTGGRGRGRTSVYPTTFKTRRDNARRQTLLKSLDAGKG